MSLLKSFTIVVLCVVSGNVARAAEGPGLPLVYDPQTKKYFIGGDVKFLIKPGTASGAITSIEVSIDGNEFRPYEDAIRIKQEGKHTLRFRAKNPVNDWSPVQFTEVFVDLTPPTTEAVLSENTTYKDGDRMLTSVKSVITLNALDSLSGVGTIEYSWDKSGFLPYLKPIKLEKAGKQTFYYRSVDKVGNAEPIKELDFIVDNTPPTSTMDVNGLVKPLQLNGKNYLATSESTSFAIRSEDDVSKTKRTWVAVDNQVPTPYISPMFFLKEGPHNLKYASEDLCGNREPWKEAQIYTVVSAPKTQAVPMGKVVNNSGVNFASKDLVIKLTNSETPVGVDHVEFRLNDDTEFRPYLEPIRFASAGNYIVSFRAVDRVGNVEPTKAYAVTIYAQTPETQITSAQPISERDGVLYSPSPNLLSFGVNNSLVGIEKILVSLNDGPLEPYKTPIMLKSSTKINKIVYRAIDRLGNEEPLRTVAYHMISASPAVDLFISGNTAEEKKMRTDFSSDKKMETDGSDSVERKPTSAVKKPSVKVAPKKKEAPKKKRASDDE